MLPADYLVIGLRGLAYAAALQAAGVVLYLQIFGRALDRSAVPIRRLALAFAAAGLLLVIAHALIDPVRLTGQLQSMFDGSLHVLLLSSDAGTALGLRLAGLALVLIGLLRANAALRATRLFGALLIVLSFTFVGHTTGAEARGLLTVLLVAHLAAAAFWFGSFGPLLVICRLELPATLARLLDGFSRLAVRIVPVLFVAGVWMAALLLGGWSDLLAPYGLFLLGKVALFSGLLMLACANRWHFAPRIRRGDYQAIGRLRITLLAEWWLAAGTIILTAAMTALTSPAAHSPG